MPIYEFYCDDCNTIFNFYSKTINTTKRPVCPKCGKRKLERQVSLFAEGGKRGEDGMGDLGGLDEGKMETAMMKLAGEAEGIGEDDPRQAARLMRKFSDMTGIKFKGSVEDAIDRMEAGEDPEKIESEMGNMLEGEDPFELPGGQGGAGGGRKRREAPSRDATLHDL